MCLQSFSKVFLCVVSLGTGLFLSCKKNGSEEVLFTELDTQKTGISFENKLPVNDSINILDYLYYYNGAGVAAGDVNADGLSDLFFVSNRGANKLYLNKGQMRFEDVSKKAGIEGKSNWKTGVSMVDINADGWLDIYVNAVGKYKGINGQNELFINNGDGTFIEKAAEYNLAFKGFSTQTAFFDYDRDGDLDAYILTHAVHSVSSYDRVSARSLRDGEAGDYLMRNDGGKFIDVSTQAGIYGAAMGYGLGIVTADIDNDGWEDIYVSNDFHEDDYYYLNQRNGTFKESVKKHFKHLSKFSMGCEVADLNNDAYLDIFTTDMHPEDETVEKLSLGEDAFDIYLYKLQFGFYNQYSRNCLQINNKGKYFQDISIQAGVSATDWSWSPLLADFDNDGLKDIYVSNGIPKRPNNMDYIKFLSSGTDSTVLRNIPVFGKKVNDDKAIEQMPDGSEHNYIFKSKNGLSFEDKSVAWGFTKKTVSNGSVYVDLDNDGDLDLVSNNLGSTASLYQNNTEKVNPGTRYLQVSLKGKYKNTRGIGAKVYIKSENGQQVQAMQPIRGFMSAQDGRLHFGLGKDRVVDSLWVIWPKQKMQILTQVKTNQILLLKEEEAQIDAASFTWFQTEENNLMESIDLDSNIVHKENDFIDFIREPLVPFKSSEMGPKYAIADINADGLQDFYQCRARFSSGLLGIQTASGQFTLSSLDSDPLIYEDNDALFFDADQDGDQDLYVVSGGNEYFENQPEIKDRLYLNDGHGRFKHAPVSLPDAYYPNKSCVRASDIDHDGDQDLFVGGHTLSSSYGAVPKSFIWINDGKGHFKEGGPKELLQLGMVTDAVWTDIDADTWLDLVIVGDWMGIHIFKNEKGKLSLQKSDLNNKKGFWSGLSAHDIDADGDQDLVIGNLGLNTKFIKQAEPKLKMHANDMDGNGILEQLIAYEKNGQFYPAASRDDLSRMAPGMINQRYPSYKDYAGKTLEQLFNKEELHGPKAVIHEVNTFESVYLINNGKGEFTMKALPSEVQVSKINASRFINTDAEPDLELLMGGNIYGVSTYQGRYDASFGHIYKFKNGNWHNLDNIKTGFVLDAQVRDIKQIKIGQRPHIWVGRNHMRPQVFRLKNSEVL
jgi:enediyne biosynthesis protein E4